MTVRDAALRDIYVDEGGKLWRCIATCGEPTVIFEEVEGRTQATNTSSFAQQATQLQSAFNPSPPPIIKDRKSGGVNGAMWNGWKRIYRLPDDHKSQGGGGL